MNNDLMFSSKNEKWGTPQDIFDELDKEFSFTLDPCCEIDNAKCSKFYTQKENGLIQNWSNEIVFCNPPYGKQLKHWVKKCHDEALKGVKIVMLIPARTDTIYFHDFIYHKAEIRFLKGRIKFINPDTKKVENSAPFPSMVVVFN